MCPKCDGSGINTHLNESEPKCSNCSGSGVRPTCKGSGRWYIRPPDIFDPEINKL